MRIERVDPASVYGVAIFAKHLIDKASGASVGETTESLVALAANGNGHFWLIRDGVTPLGVCFWQVIERPRDKVLAVLALGGERGMEWADLIRLALKQQARQVGATKLATIGRSGWSKIYGLKPVGYYYEDEV